MSKTRIVTTLLVIAIALAVAPTGAAKVVRCDQHHPHECAKLRHHAAQLERAVEWQKKKRSDEIQRILDNTRGAMPFAYAAKLAHAACLTFSYDHKNCRPPSEMLSVGRCESGLQNHDPNPVSTADGWLQFLDSTWAGTVPARLGFSLYDPVAMAIAAEGMARHGWRAWAASGSCHGLT